MVHKGSFVPSYVSAILRTQSISNAVDRQQLYFRSYFKLPLLTYNYNHCQKPSVKEIGTGTLVPTCYFYGVEDFLDRK